MKKELRKPLLGAIRECEGRPELEAVLELFGVIEIEDKVEALKEAMYNPRVFFSDGDMDLKNKYETIVGAFLSKIWKDDE